MNDNSANLQSKLNKKFIVFYHMLMGRSIGRTDFDNTTKSLHLDDEYVACEAYSPLASTVFLNNPFKYREVDRCPCGGRVCK